MRNYPYILIIISLMLSSTFTIAEITEVGHCDTPGEAMDVHIQGNYAYIADDSRGLTVIDISDPENPEVTVTFTYDNARANGVYIVEDIAYIADDRNFFMSFDISDLDDIRQLDSYDIGDDGFEIAMVGDVACVACDSDDLQLFDVSDPGDLQQISICDISSSSKALCVVEDKAYMGQYSSGLYIVDISDPENPDIIGSVGTQGSVYSIYVSGNYAYVSDYNNGLKIIDVSDPENPEIVGNSDVVSVWCIFVVGDYVFADYYQNQTLSVIDVSNPEEPETVETYNVGNILQDIIIIDNYAYIANSNDGLLILDVSEYTCTGPRVGLSDEVLNFEQVGLELTGELPLTITNIGNEDLSISDISVENNLFSINYEDEFTLEPDEEAEFTVTFSPEERGEFEGSITITSNDEQNGEIEVPLSGEGVGAVCWFNPRSLSFGVVGIDISSEETINFRNRGLNDLVISDLTNENDVFTTDFLIDIIVEPDEYHSLTVTFTPTNGIEYHDTLTFTTNDPDNDTVAIPMYGRGMGAVIVLEPDTVRFDEVGINQSAERTINIRNEGEIDLNITEIFTEGAYFSINLDTVYVVEPDASMECTVTFSPTEIGDFNAWLFITCDDRQREEVIIPLYGTGKGPEIAVDADSLDFGLLPCDESKELILTIRAVGLTDLTVTGVTIRGAPTFQSAFEDEVFIELNGSFELPVSFNPGDDGILSGVVTIHSDDAENGELEVPLNGCAHRGIMIDTLGTISDLTVEGDLMYLVTQNSLMVFDISNPNAPEIAGNYHAEGLNAINVFVDGDYAYIATGDEGFSIFDVSVVDSMQFVSSYNTDGYTHSLIIRDDYAYVADGETGLRVIDLYDPERPAEVSHVNTPGEAYAVTIAGDYAYVADYVQGLRIIDISDPQEPEEVGYFNTRGWSMDVVVSGGFAYVADERYGLKVIDISEPGSPDVIGIYDTDGDSYGVHVVGDHAYLADGEGGMYMLDISVPEAPSPAKIFYTPGIADAVIVSDNYAFIADRSDLLIIDVSEFLSVDELTEIEIPDGFILQPAFPNPFNAVTSIRYGLPYATHVSVNIYDVTGRRIDELYTGQSAAGFQTVMWNAAGFRSGVYLVRLEASGFIMVRKVMLVK
ncbi:MAG: choice-of-anchor D domain-containing protein [Calditrichaeota bacterium]|nr:choice-of-anchor D domain-containing protein [Calditrichota bacterium]